jgi:hypothetical protein
MGAKRQNSHVEFQILYENIQPQMEHNAPLMKRFADKQYVWKSRCRWLRGREAPSRLTPSVISHVGVHSLQMMWRGWYFASVTIPKELVLSNHEQNISQTQIVGRSTKYLTDALQNCQGHQNQGKSEKPPQSRRAKETRWLNVMWCPEWSRKKSLGKTNKISMWCGA